MSTYSQNPVLDDLPEEPEKPACIQLYKARLKQIGKLGSLADLHPNKLKIKALLHKEYDFDPM